MPVEITAEITGLQESIDRYGQANAQVNNEMHGAMAQSVIVVRNAVRGAGPFDKSIIGSSTPAGPVVLGQVKGIKKHTSFVERGVGPRVILPRIKKALWWPGAPHPVRKVNWPGFSGRWMFRSGLAASRSRVDSIFNAAMDRVAAFMDGK